MSKKTNKNKANTIAVIVSHRQSLYTVSFSQGLDFRWNPQHFQVTMLHVLLIQQQTLGSDSNSRAYVKGMVTLALKLCSQPAIYLPSFAPFQCHYTVTGFFPSNMSWPRPMQSPSVAYSPTPLSVCFQLRTKAARRSFSTCGSIQSR